MRTDTVVGYTFNADQYHPWCIAEKLAPEATTEYGNEVALDRLAAELGIDRNDEQSYDSGDFPKVIFADQAESDEELCGGCGEALIA
jgi:hypothetical protein